MIVSLLVLVVLMLVYTAGFFVASHAKSELSSGRRYFMIAQHVLVVVLMASVAFMLRLDIKGMVIFAAMLAMHFILRKEAYSLMLIALVFSFTTGDAAIVSSAIAGLYLLLTSALLTGIAEQERWDRTKLFMKALPLYFLFVVVAIFGLLITNFLNARAIL
jgi:hypothetical protein